MDALTGYGSDSDSNESNGGEASALSGLLGNYADDDNDDASVKQAVADRQAAEAIIIGDENPKKRFRRWDKSADDAKQISIKSKSINILPPPRLLPNDALEHENTVSNGDINDFQLLILFPHNYTAPSRQLLSSQLQSQQKMNDAPAAQESLSNKLDQMFHKFQQNGSDNAINLLAASSFATHLKAQHEFGNPHLLKEIIDHFHINPLESNVGNSFQRLKYVDRLVAAEEKSRIAASNYQASRGGDATKENV